MANAPKAPSKAPAQVSPATGEGTVGKTAPTFSQNPKLKSSPASKQVRLVSNQPQPPRKGPAAPVGYDAQQQGTG